MPPMSAKPYFLPPLGSMRRQGSAWLAFTGGEGAGVARRANPAFNTNTAQRRKIFPLYAKMLQGLLIPSARWIRPHFHAMSPGLWPARTLPPFCAAEHGWPARKQARPLFERILRVGRAPRLSAARREVSGAGWPASETQQWGRFFAPFLCSLKERASPAGRVRHPIQIPRSGTKPFLSTQSCHKGGEVRFFDGGG